MMSWLFFSQISSFFGISLSFDITNLAHPISAATVVAMVLAWSAFAIGGFVVVGKMLLEFGTCSLF
jgi:hypothetical protein